ncbi:swi5-like zinc finger protein [Gaertneriomyces sp. JEL0708]|nr:swi5-like zinc finger protein [Gaertneriomyces sp. JEL0708]
MMTMDAQRIILDAVSEPISMETLVKKVNLDEGTARRTVQELIELQTLASETREDTEFISPVATMRSDTSVPSELRTSSSSSKIKAELVTSIVGLRATLAALEESNRSLCEGLNIPPETDLKSIEAMLQKHIKRLHDYNETKDIGQMLIGKCAEREGTTTRSMYSEFGLDLDD